jgi:hypothetical protein
MGKYAARGGGDRARIAAGSRASCYRASRGLGDGGDFRVREGEREEDQSKALALTLREGHRRALVGFPSSCVREKGCRSLFERGR